MISQNYFSSDAIILAPPGNTWNEDMNRVDRNGKRGVSNFENYLNHK